MATEVTTAVSEIPCETATARWEIRGFSRLRLECSSRAEVESKVLLRVADVEFKLLLKAGDGTDETRHISVGYGARALECDASFRTVLSVVHRGTEKNCRRDEVKDLARGSKALYRYPEYAQYRELRSYTENDYLILQIRVEAWPTSGLQDVPSDTAKTRELGQLALSHDFGELLREGINTDVELRFTGAEPLQAHRLVLAARSPVFRNMLFSGFSESAPNSHIEMSDADPEAARCFVQYIYTDRIPAEMRANDEMMCHVLALAIKYQVQSLVDVCADDIAAKLTHENACERLMMADMLSVPRVKQHVLCFVTRAKDQFARIQGTDGYARLVQQRPHLLADILGMSAALAKKRPPPEPPALPEDLGSLTVADLKGLLSQRGLSTSGNKAALVNRLRSLRTT
eukprot:TRINITY_DN18944_c0_g1_i1.p1 TRINITY_DN18944_c0_g1~~TRINITY_DN18944_c0_g1_i1.p1  ORF type:complete len:425 (+),score=49.98 TRINITY_DN18944_c0_g1_i1:74-1276(+)